MPHHGASHMNTYSERLKRGALEVLEYLERNRSKLRNEERRWESLAQQMTDAALLTDSVLAQNAIHAIAYHIVDEFPLSDEFSPSFNAVLDAVQRAQKRRDHKNG